MVALWDCKSLKFDGSKSTSFGKSCHLLTFRVTCFFDSLKYCWTLVWTLSGFFDACLGYHTFTRIHKAGNGQTQAAAAGSMPSYEVYTDIPIWTTQFRRETPSSRLWAFNLLVEAVEYMPNCPAGHSLFPFPLSRRCGWRARLLIFFLLLSHVPVLDVLPLSLNHLLVSLPICAQFCSYVHLGLLDPISRSSQGRKHCLFRQPTRPSCTIR